MDLLIDSPEIRKLLGEENSESPDESIPYKKIHPYVYIPETITSTERFIGYEIEETLNTYNKVYRQVTIYFYVFCHKDVVRYKDDGRLYLWYDKVTSAIDEIISSQTKLSVKDMELVANRPYYPQTNFTGRLLTFRSLDYADGKKYGK